ncbi:MAG: GreA/GreB family elongation factor [Planctomycetota bacterium]|nr:GreA/GreB family elongation factor [Planctomycetota bacterium]
MSGQATESELHALKNRIRGAARARDFNKVTELWGKLIGQDGDLDRDFCYEIAQEVSGRGDKDQAGRLLFDLLPKLQDSQDEVFELLRRVAKLAPRIPELREELITQYRRIYGHYNGLEAALKRTGLLVNGSVDKSVAELDDAFYFKEGDFVFHTRGWGIGKVVDALPENGDIIIDFHEKVGHRMNSQMARRSLTRKPADDFDVLLWQDPALVKTLSTEDPIELLKKALRTKPQMVARDLRERISGDDKILTKSEWTKFWAAARRKARQDPWVDIGPSPKCLMSMREKPLDREEEVGETVRKAPSFAARIKMCYQEIVAVIDARKKDKNKGDTPPSWLAQSLMNMEKDLKRKRKDKTINKAGRIEFEMFKAHVATVYPNIVNDLRISEFDKESITIKAVADFPIDPVEDPEDADPTAVPADAAADPTAADPTASAADPTASAPDPTSDPTAADPTAPAADPTAADPTAAIPDPTADPTAPAVSEAVAEDTSDVAVVTEPVDADQFVPGPDFLTQGVVDALQDVDDMCTVVKKMTVEAYRRRMIKLIIFAFPDTWLTVLKTLMLDPPIGLFDNIANELIANDAHRVLSEVAAIVNVKPKDHPVTLSSLTRSHFKGLYEDHLPRRSHFEILTKHLSVLDHIFLQYRSALDKKEKALKKAIVENLKGVFAEKSLGAVQRVIDDSGQEETRRLLFLVRQSPSVTRAVVTNVETLIAKVFPLLLAATKKKSDSDGGFVMTTRAGLARREEERRHLLEVEIPLNKEDIGNALAQGDISENAELDAARQKQELLSKKLQLLESELSRVKLIDFKKLKGRKVEVGCEVRVKNLESNEVNNFVILGPWDTNDEKGYISYLSPVAQGILGRKSDEKAEVKLPGRKDPVMFQVLMIGIPDATAFFSGT